MAGGTGTPLPRKLGIGEGARVALVRAPDGFAATLEPLPEGVILRTEARGTLDLVVFFVTRRSELERRVPKLVGRLAPEGGLWVAWPTRASGVATDLREPVVRTVGRTCGLVDNKACAVSDAWSGLRFVYPVAGR